MKRLLFLLFAIVILSSLLSARGSAVYAKESSAVDKTPAVEKQPVKGQKLIDKHTPLSDHPLTREEREKLKKEEKKKVIAERRKDLPPIKMVYVKGGCFDMGDFTGKGDDDEVPVHEVCLSDYYIGEVEVTNDLWEHVMGFPFDEKLDPKMPLRNITMGWVNNFIKNLNILTDGFYRLPTEAEWEYAARERGKNIRWSGTNNDENIGDYAWFLYNSDSKIHHVGTKKPNALGIYDMTGNVWEWVEDNFDFDYYKNSEKEDPYGPDFSVWRSIRGGSVFEEPYKLRNTYRYGQEPNLRSYVTGFRLAE